jgi:DNA polymerase-4
MLDVARSVCSIFVRMVLPPPSRKIVAHVDMNSFFASAEQQADPALRGRPVAVCSYAASDFSSVIAASVEAKRLGVKVGMRLKEARMKAPGIVGVTCDPTKYKELSARALSVFSRYTDRVEPYSIDEAFLDLTGWYRDMAEAAWGMTYLRRRIRAEVGEWMGCSVGLAPTRFLAKTASDLQKPNGLAVITPQNLDQVLAGLDLEDVCGIGRRMRRQFERRGMYGLLDVKRTPPHVLIRAFGKQGFFFWCRLNGLEFERVHTAEELYPKSVGHSYWVPRHVSEAGLLPSALMKLTDRAGRRLRRLRMRAGAVHLSVGISTEDAERPSGPFWRPGSGEHRSAFHRFGEPASDAFSLVAASSALLAQVWNGEPSNFIAVTLVELVPEVPQSRVETETRFERAMDRRLRVSRALDRIRDRHGSGAIMFAPVAKLSAEHAPERIGFRKMEGVRGADVAMLSGGG